MGFRRKMGVASRPRRWLVLALAFGLVPCIGIAAGALAAEDTRSTCLRSSDAPPACPGFPPLQVTIDAAVRPQALPKHEIRPVALELESEVTASGGTHPSALREVVIDLDRDIALDSAGLPVCSGGWRDIRRSLGQVAKLCHDAIVGRGRANFEIEFPEQGPIKTASKVIVFNAAAKGASAHLVADAEVDVPAPTIVGMSIEVGRAHKGDGPRAVVKVPPIAGGSGSLLGFHLRIKRLFGHGQRKKSLVTARCSDGAFKLGFPKILFRNEVHTPGIPSTTLMTGGLAIPCNPTG